MSDPKRITASNEDGYAMVELDSGENIAFDPETDTYLLQSSGKEDFDLEGEKREINGQVYRSVSEQYVEQLGDDLLTVLKAKDPAERLFELKVDARRRTFS